MPSTIADIPVEVFLDNIVLYLSARDLLSLGSVNRAFHLITSDETLWHRKLQADYNFSGSDTARTTGWKFIYQRLSNPEVYVWGESSNSRLGLGEVIPRSSIHREGVPFPVHLRLPNANIISLVAGGMSFHALDSKGNLHVWGVLDGTSFGYRNEGFSEPSMTSPVPIRLELPAPIRSVSCGRLHAAALDSTSTNSPETTPIQVECGWSFTAILMQTSDVLVYWPRKGRIYEAIKTTKRHLDEHDSNSKAYVKDGVVPCHCWDLKGINPVQLPPIPAEELPELPGTGPTDETRFQRTKLVRIAGMDNYIIGLTNKGHVLCYSMLNGEDTYQQGRWHYLPWFSELEKVKQLPPLAASEGHLELPQFMQITHITAHFQTFVAYSTGSQSVVLMRKISTEEPLPTSLEELQPTLIPELQYKSVISVVVGDYHYGALTSTGRLFTWGAFSKGALGLGDPVKIAVGEPGGFSSQDDREVAENAHGWMAVEPPEVEVPTEVRFDHELERSRETYCFAVAAAGWHMGALIIGLEKDDKFERPTVPYSPLLCTPFCHL
ncbi:Regulator of chromosome condensation 1/beta-lactamase-inhibitor protein II [Abortiporus biennis]